MDIWHTTLLFAHSNIAAGIPIGMPIGIPIGIAIGAKSGQKKLESQINTAVEAGLISVHDASGNPMSVDALLRLLNEPSDKS